jgi:hypothetical protein
MSELLAPLEWSTEKEVKAILFLRVQSRKLSEDKKQKLRESLKIQSC